MQLIPATPYQTNSTAEYRLFKKLKEAFYEQPLFIAFHSLNLTQHSDKRFSEIDFLILCEYGLYVLEVKGGGVRYQNGHWYTVNQTGTQYAIQHPFKQAESALHALVNKIHSAPHLSTIRIPIGYGVVFPDIEWQQQGAEWERPTICDLRNFRHCEKWLQQLFGYWAKQPGNSSRLSAKQIEGIQQFLRPDFEQLKTLQSQLAPLQQQLVTLTEEQYRYLDIAAVNPRVLCSGGAGAGKTLLAAELARRLASEDQQLVMVCKSNGLRHYLAAHIPNENVMISTLDSVTLDQRRSGTSHYDVLIVDEGQDLFTRQALSVLDRLITGGLSNGKWYIFHDSNHQAGLLDNTPHHELSEMLTQLTSYHPVQLPLSVNCRNSTPIIHYIEDLLAVSIGQQGTGHGPAVRQYTAADSNAECLQVVLEDLLNSGIGAGEISILSPLSYTVSSAACLPTVLRNTLVPLDDYSVRKLPINTLSFAEIKHFKGLENEVIIVTDLPHPDQVSNLQATAYHLAHYYVALTRARGLLVVIWSTS